MTYFRKLFFKKVEGIRDTYVLEEGDIALDESDGKLYRGDGSTVGGILITPDAGIGYTDISVATSSADGGGGLVYNNSTGQFTFTPAVTSATDTLDTVTGRGATTTNAITVGNILTTSDKITLGNSSSAGSEAVAIGKGTAGVGDYAQAIGNNAGNSGQGVAAVAIGSQAGETSQGDKAIAIGQYAGQTSQAANSIVVNATGTALQNTTASSLVIKPIRSATNVNFLKYNSTSGEVTYDNATYLTGISGNNIAELANVHNASPSEGDVLVWDNALSYWKPSANDSLVLNNLTAGAVDVATDSFAFIDSSDSNNSKKESITDLATAMAGTNITASSGVLSASHPNVFGTVAVSGQSSIVADSSTDTLTFVAGTNITLTTNSSTDTLTINSTTPSGLSNIVEDTTPQLGGTLDANGSSIDMGSNIITDGKVGQWDTAYGWGNHASAGYLTSANTTFVGLTDTPANFTGAASKFVKVNGAGNALEFVASPTGISNLVEDTTPQLGGTLDVNGNDIDMGVNTIADSNVGQWDTAYSWGNHASAGYITTLGVLSGHTDVHTASPSDGQVLTWDQSNTRWAPETLSPHTTAWTTLTDTPANYSGAGGKFVKVNAGATGLEYFTDPGYISSLVADTTPQLGGTLDANGNIIDMGTNNITDTKVGEWDTAYGWGNHASANYLTSAGAFTVPTSIGTAGQVLKAPSSGTLLEWADDNNAGGGGGGGGLSNVVEDTTPQLGGALDTNGNNITFSGTTKAQFGAAQDLSIFHNSNHSIIRETGTGDLYLQSDNNVILSTDSGTKKMVKGVGSGETILYHNDVDKLWTSTSGVTVVDEVHTEGATPHLTLKRTDNANVPTIRFKGSGGTIGASIDFDGTSGTSNELAFQTYDGATIAERFRVTYTGISVPYTMNIDSHEIVTSSGNTDIKIDPHGTGDIILKTDGSNGQVGIGTVSAPDTALHVKSTASIVTLQRTDDTKQPGIAFQNSNGNVRAVIKVDGTNGISNEIFMETYDHNTSTQEQRLRVGHTVTTSNNVLRLERGVHERFATLTGATGTVAHDCATGAIFYHTGAAANFTANFTNLTIAQEDACNIAIIINQGNTGYIPNAVQIGGVAQTIIWQGNSAPTATDNGTDSFSFTILNDGGTYVVLGQMVTFGGV